MIVLCSVALALVLGALPQEPEPPPGMATYYMALLRRGPAWTAEKTPETEALQKAHMAHIQKMADTGKLVGAGPFGDGGEIRGIFIFRAASIDEAREMSAADPAVKAGRLALEIHPWWGPKGIGDGYAARVKADPKAEVPMTTYQLAFLTKGPSWTPAETPEIAKLQEAHLAHIRKMAESGKLIAAGPFLDGGDLRGVFVFKATPEEAKALAAEDPMVEVGRLVLDFHPWWVAEGVMN